MEPQKKSSKAVGIVIGIIVVIAIVLVTILSSKKAPAVAPATDQTSSDTTTTSQLPPADTTTTTTTTTSASVYKDGTYSATGSYQSPGGQDQIAVTLTLKNDIITDVTATPEPGDHTSARYQNMFISGYKQYVVGQNIASVHLTKVSGSSLTPAGFDNALAQIEAQAKA